MNTFCVHDFTPKISSDDLFKEFTARTDHRATVLEISNKYGKNLRIFKEEEQNWI